jgi:hypothetical protein
MRIASIFFVMAGLGAFAFRALATEPPPERLRENHTTAAHPANSVHRGKEQVDRNNVKSGRPDALHTQAIHPLGTPRLQNSLKKPSPPAQVGLTTSKAGNLHQSISKPPEYGGIAPKPTVGRGNAMPASIGGLTTANAKHSTAALNGATIKRGP